VPETLAEAAVTTTDRDLGAALVDAVWGLRRVTRRIVRETFPQPALPPSEAELLAAVSRAKGITVNEAAQALQLAPNTVSTLVGRLVRAGLLQRRADLLDRRTARLHLTVAGQARVRQFRRHRERLLDRALRTLDDDERRALARALPAMQRLAGSLEAISAAGPAGAAGGGGGR
jgi:DNA-binding MarR family transcriptional regulator